MNDSRHREWLETDGLGGFASGTISGLRTRRYHGLLVTATTPPTGRMMLVSGLDVTVETPGGRWSLSTQRYAPDVIGGDGEQHIESFGLSPWPTWIFRLPDGTRITQEILMRAGAPQVFVSWRLLSGSRAPRPAPDLGWTKLIVRPFLAGRDFHALMHENAAFWFDPEITGGHFRYRPYTGAPTIVVSSSGDYRHQPLWYRGFLYEEEQRRGLDCVEDLGSPGEWLFELADGEAAMVFNCERLVRDPATVPAREAVLTARTVERQRRERLGSPRARGRPVPGEPPRWSHDHRRLPVVRRLGARHVHRDARPLSRHGSAGGSARHPRRLGRHGLRRHAAESLSGRGRRARIQLGRCVALWYIVVGARIPSRRRGTIRRSRGQPRCPSPPRGGGDPPGLPSTARATAFAS